MTGVQQVVVVILWTLPFVGLSNAGVMLREFFAYTRIKHSRYVERSSPLWQLFTPGNIDQNDDMLKTMARRAARGVVLGIVSLAGWPAAYGLSQVWSRPGI